MRAFFEELFMPVFPLLEELNPSFFACMRMYFGKVSHEYAHFLSGMVAVPVIHRRNNSLT